MIDYARRMIIVLIMALFISLLFLGGTIGHALSKRVYEEPAKGQAEYFHNEEASALSWSQGFFSFCGFEWVTSR